MCFDSSGPTSTSTTTNPWQENWKGLINNVTGLTGGGAGALPVYGGPTVAPLSGNQQAGIGMSNWFAQNGSPTGNAGNAAIQQIAGGQANPFMGADPFLRDVINPSNQMIAEAYHRGTAGDLKTAAAMQGAYGGSGYQEMQGVQQRQLADALAANTSGLLSQNFRDNANLWQQGQDDRLGAAGLSLGSQQADLAAIENLMKTGGVQQGNTQAVMDAMKQYFGDSVTAQFTPAQILASVLGQAQGNSTTTMQGPGENTVASILAALGLGATFLKP